MVHSPREPSLSASRANTALLTLGRLPKALDIARALHDAGYRVIIAEPFRWHLCRVSRYVSRSYVVTAPATSKRAYLADLLQVIEDESVSLVVPISEEAMHVTALERKLPAGVRLFASPQALVLKLHDKFRFIRQAQAFALAVPETYRLGDPRAAALAASSKHVIKPVNSCAGRGVVIHDAGTPLPDDPITDFVETNLSGDDPMVVQQFVDGDIYSSFSLASAGSVRCTVVYRGVLMSGSVAVCFERVIPPASISRWVDSFIAQSNYSGFISFDFVLESDGGAKAIECNPRVTSGIHFLRPDSIAQLLLAPETPTTPQLREQPLLQLFYSCLTETQAAALKGKHLRRNLSLLWRAKDVTFSWQDPLPFWTMTLTSWQIIYKSIRMGKTFGEVATLDIDWYEG